MKQIFLFFEDIGWNIRCRYNYWLHGPYGLAKVVEKMPFRFLIKYLQIYGATIGDNCRFERGMNIHRPLGDKPFENLIIGNGVYIGHNTLIDLSRKVEIKDKVIIASRCQIWTHASYYKAIRKQSEQEYGEYYGPVSIEEGALIYSGVIITHNAIIGRNAKIGASSLVNKNVEPYSFVAGVPAKIMKATKND